MSREIIQIVGNPGSGKTELAKHLCENYDLYYIRPSAIIKAYADARDLHLVSRNDFLDAHLKMEDEFGSDYVSTQILQSTDKPLCVDGIRPLKQFQTLKEAGALSIALWCPLGVRYARAVSRGDEKDSQTLAQFAQAEAAEYNSGIPPYPATIAVMHLADYAIDSSQPFQVVASTATELVEAHTNLRPKTN
jgi:cytidylate kinase